MTSAKTWSDLKLQRSPVAIAAIAAVFLAAAVALVLYLGSDSTGDLTAYSESARQASTATRPTGSETVTGSESRSATASVGMRLALPVPPTINGFVTIDPLTGDVTPIWLGTEHMWDIDIYPGLTPGRSAIWLTWANRTAESVRFDLKGNAVDRVPGVWADESPDGGVVLYYTLPSHGRWHLVARYPNRTVDLGEGCCGVARDDGRVAFLGPFGDNGQSLLMYDPTADAAWVVAEGIGRPGKDGVIYPVWSPSGRFISDYSFDRTAPEKSIQILADTQTREVETTAMGWFWQRGPNGEDWIGKAIDGDLVYRDAVTGAEVLRLSIPDAAIRFGRDLGGAIEATTDGTIGVGSSRTWIQRRVVFDLAGNQIARWEGNWNVWMTPHGPAAVRGIGQPNCQAIAVKHPLLEGNLECGATGFQWSPDGRFLAFRVEGKPSTAVHVLDLTTGDRRTYETGHQGAWIEWNRDGSRMVIRLGGGL